MKISEVQVDTERENKGDWVESPKWPGVWVHVRSIHNPDYRRAIQREGRKLQRKYGNEPIPPEVNDNLNARLFVRHIINDLKGLEHDDGTPIEYDQDFGMQIMKEPAYRQLADFIAWAAGAVGTDESEELEEDAKNSGSASTGKQAGGSTSKHS